MAATVIANFHRQRVIPLTERSLPIFGLTPGVPASGSRTSMGVSRRCHPSRPPIPEEREVNRLHAEAVKKRKEAAEAAADRKRKRKEKHDTACKITRAEGKPWPAPPEFTDEGEGTSDAEVNLPGDDEASTGADSPPVYQEAGDEDAPATLREARPAPGLLADLPLAGTERRSPTPAAGRRSPTPAAGGRSSTPATEWRSPLPATGEGIPAPVMSTGGDGSTASARTPVQTASRLQAGPGMTPSDQSSRGVSVPRARRSGTGKCSMSARSGSGAVAKDAALLAPVKALKTGARATPHSAP
ncbi:skin secretory protein xP2-like [Panicum virgatum]|uniref:skin secretory protein xP2-like n=1 Tax=Panicum virgatum TaxID=38727 RepID=UPI0019D6A9D0|nr:skin secretory protein xP2-like [Panicum virgatum]